MDLTEAEDIKKRWQEYTEELYKKIYIYANWAIIQPNGRGTTSLQQHG